ncbi:MAG: cob(I)yrinic acid a,c-diamide adenosyltransferase [Fibrobacterota bacterium]
MPMPEFCIHLYTGEGKGKTTAAAGLALRMLSYGRTVWWVQFLKGRRSGERDFFESHPSCRVFARGGTDFVYFPDDNDRRCYEEFRKELLTALEKNPAPDLLVLDEVVHLVRLRLWSLDTVREICSCGKTEILLTGAGASQELIDMADLVTEMRNVRHYFDAGICARRGIEY